MFRHIFVILVVYNAKYKKKLPSVLALCLSSIYNLTIILSIRS